MQINPGDAAPPLGPLTAKPYHSPAAGVTVTSGFR
jgi:hypothetical protein